MTVHISSWNVEFSIGEDETVTNILIEQSKSPYNTKRIDFDILPTKDKETIDRSIQIK